MADLAPAATTSATTITNFPMTIASFPATVIRFPAAVIRFPATVIRFPATVTIFLITLSDTPAAVAGSTVTACSICTGSHYGQARIFRTYGHHRQSGRSAQSCVRSRIFSANHFSI